MSDTRSHGVIGTVRMFFWRHLITSENQVTNVLSFWLHVNGSCSVVVGLLYRFAY